MKPQTSDCLHCISFIVRSMEQIWKRTQSVKTLAPLPDSDVITEDSLGDWLAADSHPVIPASRRAWASFCPLLSDFEQNCYVQNCLQGWWRQHVPLKRRSTYYFKRQYNPEDNSELHTRRRENLKSHKTATFEQILSRVANALNM
jgi:hypothetical protein